MVKRVTGLPLERIELGGASWQLGVDEFFLAGDQAADSLDSRAFGAIRRNELIGQVRLRIWPLRRCGRLN